MALTSPLWLQLRLCNVREGRGDGPLACYNIPWPHDPAARPVPRQVTITKHTAYGTGDPWFGEKKTVVVWGQRDANPVVRRGIPSRPVWRCYAFCYTAARPWSKPNLRRRSSCCRRTGPTSIAHAIVYNLRREFGHAHAPQWRPARRKTTTSSRRRRIVVATTYA